MAAQSMIMGDSFGKAYQYGKRKISSMSNEEFNKLDTKQLGQEILTDYRNIIPSVSQAIQESNEFQSLIVNQLAQILKDLPADLIGGVTGNQELANKLKETSESNLKGGGDIVLTIINAIQGALPGIPEAEARLVTSEVIHVIDPNLDVNKFLAPKMSTIKGLSVQQAQAQAKQTQLKFEEQLREQQRARAGSTPIKAIVPQISQVGFGTLTKKKAGQSQIMERKLLISQIANAAHNMKITINADQYNRFKKIMEMFQQKMVNLLARYQF